MAVRSVNDDDITSGINQKLRAFKTGIANSCRCTDTQTALIVFAGGWERRGLFHIFDSNQADTAIIIINYNQAFNAVLMQHLARGVIGDALAHGA